MGQENESALSHERALRDFNGALIEAVDETILAVLSHEVLEAFHYHLNSHYSIAGDDIPNRLDTVLSVLEGNFGIAGRTIAKAIARKFYSKLNMQFIDRTDYNLLDYVAEAKARLRA